MKKARSVRRRNNRILPVITVIILIFAVLGVVNFIIFTFRITANLLDNTGEKTMFEKKIYPVLMFDPISFEDPNQLDEVMLIRMALWSALLGENRDKYTTYDDSLRLMVPASDLDVEARKLFGDAVTLSHQSFGDYEIYYAYTEENQAYHIPVLGQMVQYTPRVEKIQQEGDVFYLTVGYIPPATLWNTRTDSSEVVIEPDKYRIYVLQKVDKDYIITAIRDAEDPALSSGTGEESGESSEE